MQRVPAAAVLFVCSNALVSGAVLKMCYWYGICIVVAEIKMMLAPSQTTLPCPAPLVDSKSALTGMLMGLGL